MPSTRSPPALKRVQLAVAALRVCTRASRAASSRDGRRVCGHALHRRRSRPTFVPGCCICAAQLHCCPSRLCPLWCTRKHQNCIHTLDDVMLDIYHAIHVNTYGSPAMRSINWVLRATAGGSCAPGEWGQNNRGKKHVGSGKGGPAPCRSERCSRVVCLAGTLPPACLPAWPSP